MEGQLLLLVLSLLTAYCLGNTIQREGFEYSDSHLYDDILLTPDQKEMLKERGFFVAGRWPIVNDVAVIPYYFDERTIPYGSPIRTTFQAAADLYRAQTCIEWMEVQKNYPDPKVKVFRGDGCQTNVGMNKKGENTMSLGNGCDTISVIIHEMGHSVGLHHTQSRPDRDQYIKIWYQNIENGKEEQFEIAKGQATFGLPYDYRSMMHYGNNYFSKNGSFTITAYDAYATFAMGSRVENFRWTDAAMINLGYGCAGSFAAKCPARKCQNDGYVGKDCKCKCPENTRGALCETVTGPLFADVPKCGGVIKSPQEITSFQNGMATDEVCIFKIEAPRCTVPAITFTYASFYWTECKFNKLAVQVYTKHFGATFCGKERVPLGKAFVSDSSKANIYYYTNDAMSTTSGFRARVDFLRDTTCK